MESSRPAVPRIRVGDVINETFSVYGQNFGAVFGSALLVFAVVGIVSGLLADAGGVILALIATIVRLAGHALYTGFVVKLVQDVRDGRRDQSVGDLFEAAMPAIVSLIVFGILFGIAVGIGFFFLIVPGLILITFWSVGVPAIVVEGAGPIDAFGRSWRLVRGDAWSVFGVLLIVLLIVIAISFVLGLIGAAIGAGGFIVATIVSAAVTAPIFSIAVSVVYFELKGGFDATPAAAPAPPTPPPTV